MFVQVGLTEDLPGYYSPSLVWRGGTYLCYTAGRAQRMEKNKKPDTKVNSVEI